MIINGVNFSERELEYIQRLDNGERDSVIEKKMGNRYPLNPQTVQENFGDILISAFNNANKTKK